MNWRLPVGPQAATSLLELLAGLQENMARLNSQVTSTEDELNALVFSMYGVSQDEQKVIDDFLTRYSSTSKAAAVGEAEVDAPE